MARETAARAAESRRRVIRGGLLAIGWALAPSLAGAQGAPPAAAATQATPVDRLRDRGEGLATSQFGTYVRRGEWLVYPFYEYYRDEDFEYAPSELGAVGDEDYRGRYRAHEGLIFVAYGLTDDFAFEIEVAVIDATLEKAANDPSGLPASVQESGLGDIEGQLRWRWRRETDRRPEVFSYAEVVLPHADDKPLTGTPGWELKFGAGVVRGFGWGTLSARAAIDYEEASTSHFDLGEYAVEYLRRLSPAWRVYAGVEGSSDEVSFIGELQWHVNPHVYVKINNGIGLTSKATDWAPEIGVVFSLGR
jgi:hypothetical protein